MASSGLKNGVPESHNEPPILCRSVIFGYGIPHLWTYKYPVYYGSLPSHGLSDTDLTRDPRNRTSTAQSFDQALVHEVNQQLNLFPAKGGVSAYFSPHVIIMGQDLDYNKDCLELMSRRMRPRIQPTPMLPEQLTLFI